MAWKFPKKTESTMYVIFRIVIGLLFLMHGMQKFGWLGTISPGSIEGAATAFGLPAWLMFLVALVEFLGGLGIALGLFTRLWAVLGLIDMVGAQIVDHLPVSILPIANRGELSMLYLVSFLVIFAMGAGKCSLEKAIFKKEQL